MNILLINPFSRTAAVRQCNLARNLQKQGNNVTLMLPLFDQYSGFEPRMIPEDWNISSIHPFQFRSKRMELCFLFYIPSAVFKCLGKKYHVVHAFRPTPFSGLIGYLISRIKRIPFVIEHGDIEWETMKNLKTHPGFRVRIVRWLEAFLTKKAEGVTVMNTNVKQYVLENYHPNGIIQLIPNGVDTEYFSPDQPSKRNELMKKIKARKIMMYVGKLDNIEHIQDLIYVLKELGTKYGLVIVGGGKRKEELQGLAKKLKVDDLVFFTGMAPHEDIPQYLNAADILLAPFARTKGVEHASNLKVFEYMSMGKPIVATDVGDLAEVLDGCGVLVEPGDIKALAKAIVSAKPEMGQKARDRSKKYDWKNLAKEVEDLYDKIQ